MIMLVVLCVWHSVIASLIFLSSTAAKPPVKMILPSNIYVKIDRYIFMSLFIIYIIIHILLVIWLIFVPYKRRREMKQLDREYIAQKYIRLDKTRTQYGSIRNQSQDLEFHHTSSSREILPINKSPVRPMKYSDAVGIIPNLSKLLPTKEKANEMTTKISNTIELREQNNVLGNHTD